jgi:hypothetical protein
MKQESRNEAPEAQTWVPPYLSELPPPRRFGPLERWYRLTAPPEPPPSANFRRHEAARRGRLISLLLLMMIILVFIVVPLALFSGNYPLLLILFVALVAESTTLALNRKGHVLLAGLLIVSVAMLGYILAQAFNPGGLRVGDLPDFDLMVQVELLAVSLLPARSVFVVATLDSLFIWADITFQPHAPDLAHFLITDGYAAVGRPIFIQIVVAVILYLWVRSATQAIVRADRAEVIAALERTMARREREIARHSRELGTSAGAIVETLQQAASGKYHARVSLPEEDVLWPIADELNTFLLRFQRQLAEAEELSRTKMQSARLVAALRSASLSGQPLQLPRQGAGTAVDLVILELLSYLSKQETASSTCPRREEQPGGEATC